MVKNKIAPPFRNAEFNIINTRGIDYEGDLLKLAVEDDIIEKGSGRPLQPARASRSRYGESNTVQFPRENPTIREEIAAAVLEHRKPKPPEASERRKPPRRTRPTLPRSWPQSVRHPEAEPVKKKRGKAADMSDLKLLIQLTQILQKTD
ncbi:MAG: hypothetical protein U0792_20345 [Gemmataceae bacterium]